MGVKLREKRGRLYLDVYHQGRRTWEALGLSIGKDAATNREVWRLAEVIRQKREMQLASGAWGLLDPIEGKRSLYSYAAELAAKQSPLNHLPKSLEYLAEYGQEVRLAAVTEKWLEGYKEFLLAKPIATSTAAHYYNSLKTVLRRAVRDRVLPSTPRRR